jgi:DNA-binding MarR family transcriptional regulator
MSLVERLAIALGQLKRMEDEKTWLQVTGTSQAQMQFVMWVGSHPGCRLQQIATGLELSAPTVSVGVQRLEQAGLLQRALDEHDQRAINLVLSPKGQQLYDRAIKARERNIKTLLERLKPAEQRQLVELLERSFNNTAPGSQVSPHELPSVPTDEVVAKETNPDTVVPPGPRQLDFFGG